MEGSGESWATGCLWGATRAEAVARQAAALDAYYVRGVGHNISFLAAIMAHESFQRGDLSTGFIDEHWPDGFHGAEMTAPTRRILAAAVALAHLSRAGAARSFDGVAALAGATVALSAHTVEGGADVALSDGNAAVRGTWSALTRLFLGTIDGRAATVQVDPLAEGYFASAGGIETHVILRNARTAELVALMPDKPEPDTSNLLLSPMPGLVVEIHVGEGDEVEAGQPLCVVDAMKMENVLRAERAGRIAKVHVVAGDSLAVDEVILEFD